MMKKLFSGANDHTGWIGKQFQVGRYLCTVESLVAEGRVFLLRNIAQCIYSALDSVKRSKVCRHCSSSL